MKLAEALPVAAPPDSLPAVSGPDRRRWLGLTVLLLWLLSAIYVVPADRQAVVTRFGRVVEPRVMPGIHAGWPWPLERVTRLKVRQLQRVVIGGDAADGVLGRVPPQSQFLTGDQNLIHLRVVAQYSVGVPVDYLFQQMDPVPLVESAVGAELTRRVAGTNVDAILTTEKAAMQDEVRAAAQRRLNGYRAGVVLASVNIESVTPPAEAANAFRDVASARADSSRIVNEALGYAGDLLPRARGEAEQMQAGSQAFRERKINEARGDADRFTQVAAEYAKASQVTGRRLYLEAMEEILPKIRKIIVQKNDNLDLTILRKAEPDAARTPR